jgi:formiminoglutamase
MNLPTQSSWPRLTDLLAEDGGDVALLGAPMGEGSVTPGRCDLSPAAIRQAMRRFSTYDVETGEELSLRMRDLGDIDLAGVSPDDGLAPIRDAVAGSVSAHKLTLLLGGNNAVTRPAAHGLGVPLQHVGLVTLDAHFDLRDTDSGLSNGNPIRALLEDGLPGANICQIGLAPFANTRKMHETAKSAGIAVYTVDEVKHRGILRVLDEALPALDHCAVLMVDFDIDVIDRAQCPGAPGARPGGLPVDLFFDAARYLGSHPKVKLVDLTEFDPSLDVSDITALTAGRWVCEILSGFANR